ncbi:ligase-associated DNA damage response DEXH box helicase [Neptunitalea lumnitzerae]|uniref:DNA ligase-associated DEXH box helicase n=1 Tax=Neptunitalea lumnitzerae TaxID=2965509 RepID=A0ABQ5MHF9_9FLAO|nr:ligase-associated DNA damage response DEXH box helicase [Neptunitalea sp. Y10]GLB48372.1 DNA ligase-associated DEXH box helicase [Neptunitalea sp. Y10]
MPKKQDISYHQKVTDWFQQQGWQPFPFQEKTWKSVAKGKNGLLNAPTGSGKTYALWIGFVLKYLQQHPEVFTKPEKGLKVIWVTPLRALAAEIQQTTQRFCNAMEIPFTVGLRTGDTSTAERSKQKKQMPDLLITTPESLHLLLASKNYPKLFKSLEGIVIDEWHELLGSKRGVQTELALSRLKTICPTMLIWGISATIGNLEQAMEVLLGTNNSYLTNSVLIKSNIKKKIRVSSIIPEQMERFPWRGHLGLHLLEEIIPIIKSSKTSLIFTNTRSQCELWYQAILEAHPEFAGEIAMHHGSIHKETRLWVEGAIRNESLKAVVCTSSLDLGVDFAPVETIIQIGGPKGVARFLQRAGRSNHQPGKESIIYFLPTHAIELIEASALQQAVKTTTVEDRIPYLLSFDVLVQYLITLAVSDGFHPDDIFKEVQTTFCFQALSETQWLWVLNFITKGSQTLQNYDEYQKVTIEENGTYKVNNRGIAMRHRLSIGTIVSDAILKVKYVKGPGIGTIEEWFVSKLKPGDVFTFAGRNLELFQIKNMQVLVKKSKSKNAKVPSWMGGRMSFSSQMSTLLREELYKANHPNRSREIKALSHLFNKQKQESIVPEADQFLIETFKTREGYHTLFYPFEGRFVHEAMGSLLAYRISLLQPITFSIAFNDYGFELLSDQEISIQEVLDNDLFTARFVTDDLQKSLNATEMARRKFRDIAVIAGLVFQGYPNKLLKSKHLQSSSQLLFNVFKDFEPDNLLYQQAYRETFEHTLEEGRLIQAMERISNQQIVHKQCSKPTPFSFPIITDRLREKLSSEKVEDRIKRMLMQLEKD